MDFDLVRPCKHCPFRTDIAAFLTKARAREIMRGMVNDQKTFTCHKTTVAAEEDDEEGFTPRVDGPKAQHCAGALILLERMERPNQLMRIAERLGAYDRHKLDMASPVFETAAAFIKAQPR